MANFTSWESTAVRLATETAGNMKGTVILNEAAKIKLKSFMIAVKRQNTVRALFFRCMFLTTIKNTTRND